MEVNGVGALGALGVLGRIEEILGRALGGVAGGPDRFDAALALAEGGVVPTFEASASSPPPDGPVSDGGLAGPLAGWAARLPAAGRRWASAIDDAARRHGLDPALLAALVWAESSFRPGALSPAGAVGLTQLMPQTAAGLGVDPYDPIANLDGGARYLAAQIRRFGSVELGLAAYQAGPAAVAAAGAIPDPGTGAYVERVLSFRRILGDAGGASRLAPGSAGVAVAEVGSVPVSAATPVGGPLRVVGEAATSPRSVRPSASAGSDPVDGSSGRIRSTRTERTPEPDAGIPGGTAEPAASDWARSLPVTDPVGAGPQPSSPSSGRDVPPSPAHPVAGRDTVVRVMEAVERLRDAAPPRRVAVELPELGGLRLLVEATGTTIHVRPLGGDLTWFDTVVRDLAPGLAARGFDLASSAGRDRWEARDLAPVGGTRGSRRRSREGVRM